MMKNSLKRKSDLENNNNTKKMKIWTSWNPNSLLKLVEKIQENIPVDDRLKPSTRLDKLNWENIIFEEHSATECKQVWLSLQKQVRNFRLLNELAQDVKDWLKKLQSGEKVKHPEQPKQPLFGHAIYVLEKRESFSQKHPNLRPGEVFAHLAKAYRELPPAKKIKYQKLAVQYKEEYQDKLEEFYNKYPEYLSQSKIRKLKSYQPPPKKPRTPFEIFVQVEFDKYPNERIDNVFIEDCRIKWNEMGNENKIFWINWAEEEFHKYNEDLKKYLKNYPQYDPPVIKSLSKAEILIKEALTGRPQKPPNTSYLLFVSKLAESNILKNMSMKERNYCTSKQWKQCTEEEKKEYKQRVEQLWEQYQIDLEGYLTRIPVQERIKIRNEGYKKIIKNKKINEIRSTEPKKVRRRGTIDKPNMPPETDFEYFASVYNGSEHAKDAWNNLPSEKKEEYGQRLLQKKKQYIRHLEEFLNTLSKRELEYFAKYDKLPDDESDSGS